MVNATAALLTTRVREGSGAGGFEAGAGLVDVFITLDHAGDQHKPGGKGCIREFIEACLNFKL